MVFMHCRSKKVGESGKAGIPRQSCTMIELRQYKVPSTGYHCLSKVFYRYQAIDSSNITTGELVALQLSLVARCAFHVYLSFAPSTIDASQTKRLAMKVVVQCSYVDFSKSRMKRVREALLFFGESRESAVALSNRNG